MGAECGMRSTPGSQDKAAGFMGNLLSPRYARRMPDVKVLLLRSKLPGERRVFNVSALIICHGCELDNYRGEGCL
jgi:hypothetical protein